jgi:hypothetical protein
MRSSYTQPSPGQSDPAPGFHRELSERDALMAALRQVIEPLAELAVQRSLPYTAVEELRRRVFVGAADAAHPDCCRIARSAASPRARTSIAVKGPACWL